MSNGTVSDNLIIFSLLSASKQYQLYLKLSWVIRNNVSGYWIVDDVFFSFIYFNSYGNREEVTDREYYYLYKYARIRISLSLSFWILGWSNLTYSLESSWSSFETWYVTYDATPMNNLHHPQDYYYWRKRDASKTHVNI